MIHFYHWEYAEAIPFPEIWSESFANFMFKSEVEDMFPHPVPMTMQWRRI
jgi:hypothetical protein